MKKINNKNKVIIIISIIVLLCLSLLLVIGAYNRNIYQNASLPNDNDVCKLGYYFSEGECLTCPIGSYCERNNRYFCPEGTGSLAGSSTIMNCSKCAKGYYGSGDGEGCISCPSGTTTNDIGSVSIKDCH